MMIDFLWLKNKGEKIVIFLANQTRRLIKSH